ncbi:MAG: hypothetical protein IPJ30_11115 [Acidobacteria bacterium]|nr:hypothetical protein [Acidobacteriota bacterium]
MLSTPETGRIWIRRKRIFIVVGFLLAIGATSIFGILFTNRNMTDGWADGLLYTSDPQATVRETVQRFWEYSQTGDFEKARSLRTKSYGGFRFESRSGLIEQEEMIFETGMVLQSVDQTRFLKDDEAEVAVRVSTPDGRSFHKFHLVVKDGATWKIFSTSH